MSSNQEVSANEQLSGCQPTSSAVNLCTIVSTLHSPVVGAGSVATLVDARILRSNAGHAPVRQSMQLVGQERVLCISRRQDRSIDRPTHVDRWIVPRDANFACGIVELGALVLNACFDADDAKSVREAWRHVKLQKVVRRQRRRGPASEGGRASPYVDGDVEDFSMDDADQLSLWRPDLEVQPSNRAFDRTRLVVLDEWPGDAQGAIFVGLVGLEKVAAAISKHVWFDDQDSGQIGRARTHVVKYQLAFEFCAV
jgi:hypothetical protein